MSTIACWFRDDAATETSADRSVHDEARVKELLRCMPDWGPARVDAWAAEGIAMAIARLLWQCEPTLEGPCLVATSPRTVVVSDAALYDVRELVASLRRHGVTPAATDPSTLILHAYEQWGDECAAHLDGDYAFVVWDRRARRALLARDIIGRRALFVRVVPTGVVVASRAKVLARQVEPHAAPNLPLVAAALSGLPGGSTTSGYDGVLPVPAGGTLTWDAVRGLREVARYRPPVFQVHSPVPFGDAVEQLREVLKQVVDECRVPGRTVVWLSGGADSPAVFAAGCAAIAERNVNDRLPAVSVSYPAGDPGREDEHIEAITRRWDATVRWVVADEIPLLDGLEHRARDGDDPFVHTFAPVNTALARTTAESGAHVALDGHGGDALFEVSDAYVAELLASGDLRGWWRSRRAAGLTDWRSALRWGVLPALPPWAWTAIGRLRGRPLRSQFQYPMVKWLTPEARRELAARGWDYIDLARSPGEGPAAFEARCGIICPHFPRALSWTRDSTVGMGVELRSPLLSRRVIDFAATRPVAERGREGNAKRLLKEAMRGWLPDSVLAPRPFKTGVASGYLHRQLQGRLTPALARIFDTPGGSSALVDHGLVDPAAVLRAAAEYDARPEHLTGVALYLTLGAEVWLRVQ